MTVNGIVTDFYVDFFKPVFITRYNYVKYISFSS